MRHIISLLIPLMLVVSACSSHKGSKAIQVWSTSSAIATPECVYFDPESNILYVSNVSGAGDKKDGVGWISRIDLNGNQVQSKWVEGLNAPMGMKAAGGTLWVTDIDEVVALDKKTGEIRNRIKVDGSKFLNDFAIGTDGTIYLSDTLANRIYQIKDGKLSVFMSGDKLESPNGLHFKDGKLFVAAWGLTTDWSTKVPGRLYYIDPKTKSITYITEKPLGNLDGLEVDNDGDFIVSDWVAGKIFRIDEKGKSTVVYTGPKGFANIAFVPNKNLVVIPEMEESKVTAIRLP